MNQDTIVIGEATYAITRSFSGQQTPGELLSALIQQKMEAGRLLDAGNADAV